MAHPNLNRIAITSTGVVAVCTFHDKRIADANNIQTMGDDLFRLVDELGHKSVLLDLASVQVVSSAALGKFITLNRKVQSIDGKLVLVNLSKEIAGIFQISKLDQLLTVASSLEEAHEILGIGKTSCS